MRVFMRQRRLADAGFVALMLLAALLAWFAVQRYAAERRHSFEVQQLALLSNECAHLEGEFTRTLNQLQLEMQQLLGAPDAHATTHWDDRLADAQMRMPYLHSLSLLDPSGRITVSSNAVNLGVQPKIEEIFTPGQPSFRGMRLLAPWSGQDLGNGTSGRRAPDRTPDFIPVMFIDGNGPALIATLDSDYLFETMSTSLPPGAWVDIRRDDGLLLFTSRRDERSTQEATGWAAQRSDHPQTSVQEGPDGPVLRASLRLPNSPVAVAVSRPRADALASLNGAVLAFSASMYGLLAVLLILTAAVYLSLRHLCGQRLQVQIRTREQQTATLDALPATMLVFGDDARLRQSNNVWSEFCHYNALPPNIMSEGAELAEIAAQFQPASAHEPGFREVVQAILHRQMAFCESDYRLDTPRGARWFRVLIRHFETQGQNHVIALLLDVTRHREADERLRLNSRMFAACAEGILISDRNNHIITTNPAFTRITGFTLEEVRGEDPRQLGSGEQSQAFYAEMWKTLQEQDCWQGEVVNRHKNGHLYTEWLSISADRDEDGSLQHYIGVFSDISAIKRTEQALRASEERYRLTLAAVQDGMWNWQIGSGTMGWDSRCHEMLGYLQEDFPVTLDGWLALMHPEDQLIAWQPLHESLQHDGVLHGEFRLRTSGGLWSWVELRGRVVDWFRETPVLAVGTLTDINERKSTEQRLRLLDAAVQAAPVAIIVTDTQAVIQSVNPAFTRLTGFEAVDAIGHRPNELVRSGLQSRDFYEALWGAILSGKIWHGELINRHRNGAYYHEELTIAPVCDDSGTLRNFVAIKQDITARKNAEADLIATRERLSAVIENFQGAVVVEDEWRNIVLVNKTFCSTFGFSEAPEALMGRPWPEAISGHELGIVRPEQFFARINELLGAREPVLGEEMYMRDGRVLERDYIPIQATDTLFGHMRVYRDITERKEREKVLKRLATTDPLTGVFNRRSFMEHVNHELARHVRYGEAAALVMVDLDHFKRVNDRYGHAGGDAVLCHFTNLVRQVLRRVDCVGRLGGEEFAVLLPNTTLSGAQEFAERLRRRVESNPALYEEQEIAFCCSLGVTDFGADASPDEVLLRADQALYAAKEGGRNRYVSHPAPPPPTAPEEA